MLQQIVLYILGFFGIWIGAWLIINSVEKFSHRLKLSSFSVSFLILGLLTSVGEISIGISSLLKNDPEIFVGILIGASIVLFLLVIPLLAITGKPVKINPELQSKNLIVSLFVIGLPALLLLDGKIDKLDGILCVGMFLISAIMIEAKKGLLQKPASILHHNPKIGKEIFKIIIGIVLVFLSSNSIVNQTLYFSQILGISPFLISLMLVSIGTNLPELSLVVRSIFFKDNEIAFGDYVGSAEYNTLIFGALTLAYGKTIILTNIYIVGIAFLLLGLLGFYHFAKTKYTLSRKEGFILLSLYILFVTIQIFVK